MPGAQLPTRTCPGRNFWSDHPMRLFSIDSFISHTLAPATYPWWPFDHMPGKAHVLPLHGCCPCLIWAPVWKGFNSGTRPAVSWARQGSSHPWPWLLVSLHIPQVSQNGFTHSLNLGTECILIQRGGFHPLGVTFLHWANAVGLWKGQMDLLPSGRALLSYFVLGLTNCVSRSWMLGKQYSWGQN